MKVAFTTTGTNLNAPLEPRFGRAPRFIVYDTDKDAFEVIENKRNANAQGGAGIQAAELVSQSGAISLVTGHCGPKAFRVLSAAGVKVYCMEAPTVADALSTFRAGALKPMESSDVQGHWA